MAFLLLLSSLRAKNNNQKAPRCALCLAISTLHADADAREGSRTTRPRRKQDCCGEQKASTGAKSGGGWNKKEGRSSFFSFRSHPFLFFLPQAFSVRARPAPSPSARFNPLQHGTRSQTFPHQRIQRKLTCCLVLVCSRGVRKVDRKERGRKRKQKESVERRRRRRRKKNRVPFFFFFFHPLSFSLSFSPPPPPPLFFLSFSTPFSFKQTCCARKRGRKETLDAAARVESFSFSPSASSSSPLLLMMMAAGVALRRRRPCFFFVFRWVAGGEQKNESF